VVVACVCALVDELVGAAVDVDDDDDFFELPPQAASSATAAITAPSTPKMCPRVHRREVLIGCT
jgi:hypothetical protein